MSKQDDDMYLPEYEGDISFFPDTDLETDSANIDAPIEEILKTSTDELQDPPDWTQFEWPQPDESSPWAESSDSIPFFSASNAQVQQVPPQKSRNSRDHPTRMTRRVKEKKALSFDDFSRVMYDYLSQKQMQEDDDLSYCTQEHTQAKENYHRVIEPTREGAGNDSIEVAGSPKVKDDENSIEVIESVEEDSDATIVVSTSDNEEPPIIEDWQVGSSTRTGPSGRRTTYSEYTHKKKASTQKRRTWRS
ncbi:hypothetical protein TREMEDRAFT_61537 [Tremella mesenterica DSM 1558]|uniref:uncharacterized protein n=1 Tax=Tremella mesenterica (strain ATCC 24925 / CBS 8224 / DSM 1558 / NBRC 9311 / NRRL Y-6157 / RJB 2259-6 / UBC 559-6) TaxID=578456 RepID=UPI0003F49425|nr:uncharacterized protein TREMEDRAFT_61537 [Tremella mesenterica DSM 1558]EIW69770.1 hypothetical protein TREMEDRAFT_61537 [Tremella mesenterica DSM 1558]